MNIFNSSRYIHYLLPGLLCGITALQASAQTNNPTLSQTAVPGSSSLAIPVPAVSKTHVNFNRTFVPKVRITDASQVNTGSAPAQVAISTEYTDGQGSVAQQVLRNTFKTSGGTYKHTIVPAGTKATADRYSFMAFPSTTATFNQDACWNSVAYHSSSRYPEESGSLANDAVISTSLSKNTSSATERSVSSYAPGKGRIGQNRGTKTISISNLGYDASFKPDANIRIWTISGGMPVSSSIYTAGTLKGSRIISADGAEKIIFQDRSGKTVYEYALAQQSLDGFGNTIKTHSVTYYVYDLFGRLRFTISPKGVDAIKSNWTMTSGILTELCFEYQYDAKGRQVAVHKPGETGFTELVYDKVGKTVMRRSPLEATQQKWELVFYDNSNRVIATGLLDDNHSRSYWQGEAQGQGSAGTGTAHYYIWGAGKGTLPPLTGINNTEILSYNYYDSYSSTPLSSENFTNTLIQPYLSSAANADAYVQGPSTFNRLTATAVKVIKAPGATTGLQDWTYSKVFYDSLGRVIYSVNQHAGGLKDSSATQYSYTGQVLFNVLSHNATTTTGDKRNLQLTSNAYEDYSGRLLQSSRKINAKDWETMVTYTYNELGQVATKTLGNEAETQTFTYTVRGELRGINEQYALTGDKDDKGITFGEALRYDYGFEQPRYDGQASGMVWRGSGGTNVKANAYGYWYDRIGRMTMAEHVEATTTGGVPAAWDNTGKNFTESVTYDINGNITKLNRSGIALISGVLTPVALDRLTYTYFTNSNKIDKVTDQNTSSYPDVGDFRQGTQQGYSYDVSGNLIEDKSKDITSISYTFFNKPQVVTFGNGNKIWYSYDASGTKIQEQMLEGSTTTKLNYLGNGVYQNDVLQYLGTAEGRTDMSKTNPQEQFYVKDHLGNIRSVVASAVTSGTDPGGPSMMQTYTATYELANAGTEEQLFENVSEVREDNPESNSGSDTKAAELSSSQQDKMVGTMILLKVMSGDKLNISTQSLYNSLQGTPTNSNESSLVDHIVSSVAGMAGSLPAGETGIGTDMANQIFSTTEAQDAYFALQQSAADSTKPQAFLNYLFFDEDMKLQPDHSQLWQADGEQQWAEIGMAETETLEVPMNGYIAVYLTNQSPDATYFNNLSVILDPGVLIEEKHYYAYGLPISGMGSTAANTLPNRKRYQGNEFREELGLKWMDFQNRQYDPQLGRFLSVDPLADAGGQQTMSPYHAMGCNPVLTVDPLGLMGDPFTRGMPFLQISSAWGSESGGPRGSNVASSLGADWDNAGAWAILMSKIEEALANRFEAETGFATNTPDGSAGVQESGTGGDSGMSDHATGGALYTGTEQPYPKDGIFTLGTYSYDLNSFSKFHKQYGNKFPAEYIDDDGRTRTLDDVKINGKSAKVYAEAGSYLTEKLDFMSGTTRISFTRPDPSKGRKGTSGFFNKMSPDDAFIPYENKSSLRIHSHPFGGFFLKMTFSADKIFFGGLPGYIYDSGASPPSQSDHNNTKYISDYFRRFVEVNNGYIYLYNTIPNETIRFKMP